MSEDVLDPRSQVEKSLEQTKTILTQLRKSRIATTLVGKIDDSVQRARDRNETVALVNSFIDCPLGDQEMIDFFSSFRTKTSDGAGFNQETAKDILERTDIKRMSLSDILQTGDGSFLVEEEGKIAGVVVETDDSNVRVYLDYSSGQNKVTPSLLIKV